MVFSRVFSAHELEVHQAVGKGRQRPMTFLRAREAYAFVTFNPIRLEPGQPLLYLIFPAYRI